MHHGGPIDIAQLQSTMLTIEQACTSFQIHVNPAEAEAIISALRQSPHAYQTCQYMVVVYATVVREGWWKRNWKGRHRWWWCLQVVLR
ncbi:hypothetical protein ACHQM5_023363 [Ranunculus cassubicifolius]